MGKAGFGTLPGPNPGWQGIGFRVAEIEVPKRPNTEISRSNREPDLPNGEAAGIASPALHPAGRRRGINQRRIGESTPVPGSSAAPHILGLRRRSPTRSRAAAPQPGDETADRRDETAAPPSADVRGR